jgi:hypothetical protein
MNKRLSPSTVNALGVALGNKKLAKDLFSHMADTTVFTPLVKGLVPAPLEEKGYLLNDYGNWVGGPSYFDQSVNLSGQYISDVTVNGNATVTADLVIKGSLLVHGNLINAGGFAITVTKDVRVIGLMNLTPTSLLSTQADFSCGSLYFGANSEFKVNFGQFPNLYVYGDIDAAQGSSLDGSGQPGANALTIVAENAKNIHFICNGGNSDSVNPGGSGGYISVYDASMVSFNLVGGAGATGFNGGNGGTVTVFGSLSTVGDLSNTTIRVDGGDGDAVGGDGGFVVVHGFASLRLNMFNTGKGGNSVSGTGGAGGNFSFYAGVIADNIDLRKGTGGSPASSALELCGNCVITDLIAASDLKVTPVSGRSVILKLSNVSNGLLTTLWNLGLSAPTTSIVSVAPTATFSYSVSGGRWYKHVGVAI